MGGHFKTGHIYIYIYTHTLSLWDGSFLRWGSENSEKCEKVSKTPKNGQKHPKTGQKPKNWSKRGQKRGPKRGGPKRVGFDIEMSIYPRYF